MARKSTPQPLTLSNPQAVNDNVENLKNDNRSPLSPTSPKTPRSPFRFTTSSKKLQSEEPSMQASESSRHTLPQTTVSLSDIPYRAAQETAGERRPPKSGFFSNFQASKSSSRLQNSEKYTVSEEDMSKDTDQPAMTGRVSSKEPPRTESAIEKSVTRRPVGGPSRSDVDLESPTEPPPTSSHSNQSKKNKPKPFSLLSRTRSIRDEPSPTDSSPTDRTIEHNEKAHTHTDSLKTAPLLDTGDRSFRAMMASSVRQHSADRAPSVQRDRSREQRENKRVKEQGGMGMRSQTTANLKQEHSRNPTSFSTNGGHSFLNSLKGQATKGAGSLGKALFGKGGRSGSSHEREPVVTDEQYVIKVLNLPLVEQTRRTRISKKLEDSRDKTEFWMPAFPWRAIDYLNYKGSEEEGLYRVPGSGLEIKKWQRRFDERLDIDLFEADDLFDINIIGSMLKAWLRELPDVLLSKAAQDKIARECYGAETVPQMLIDELSNLPPFNYYLLFAITCHLSLLLAHSEKNKMDYRNLCICFQPCMKIDAFCFKFLVCDWRDCWKGCKTEAFYVEQEYILFNYIPPSSSEGRSSTAIESHDEQEAHQDRNVSSSDSSKPSLENRNGDHKAITAPPTQGNQNKKLPLSQSQNVSATSTTTLTVVNQREQQRRQNATPPNQQGRAPQVSMDMRPLSPIKPLSPIGL